jgi:DNA-binding PadR family transcriptional regulator
LSPVFRHGSLRLYLLRLLDEEPRHGYEVIRLLRDRFMGVYSPSPGTIYPRLARLEEEGLVTHDEVDGRKVYRITEAGREELRSRSVELDELEEELSASVSDIVREVREDVRQTVRSLREELTFAARESRRAGKDAAYEVRDQVRQARDEAREQARQAREDAREEARRMREEMKSQVRQAKDQTRQGREQRDPGEDLNIEPGPGADAARRVRESARQLREEAQRVRDEAIGAGSRIGEEAGARFSPGDPGWDSRGGDWPPGPGATDWLGRRGWEDWTRGRHGWTGSLDFGTLRDLERLAVQFTADLRKVAMQSSAAGENVITDLRGILEEALDRIKSEIFGAGPAEPGGREGPAEADSPASAGTPGPVEAPGPADPAGSAQAPGSADAAGSAEAPGSAHAAGSAEPQGRADQPGESSPQS